MHGAPNLLTLGFKDSQLSEKDLKMMKTLASLSNSTLLNNNINLTELPPLQNLRTLVLGEKFYKNAQKVISSLPQLPALQSLTIKLGKGFLPPLRHYKEISKGFQR